MIELAITCAMATTVMVSILGVMLTHSRAERAVQLGVANQEEVRLAMVAMQRDIRSSEPLVELSSTTNPTTTLELRIVDLDGNESRLRWSYDALTGTLSRSQLDPATGAVVGESYRLEGVANDPVADPVFRYFNADDDELTMSNNRTIADCTIRVQITLTAAPGELVIRGDPLESPFRVRSDAELRNRLPGGLGC